VIAGRVGEYRHCVQPAWLPFKAREGDVDKERVRNRYIRRYGVVNRLIGIDGIINRKCACIECLELLHFFEGEGAVPDADVVDFSIEVW
jgi:hypothetical protein